MNIYQYLPNSAHLLILPVPLANHGMPKSKSLLVAYSHHPPTSCPIFFLFLKMKISTGVGEA